MCAITYSLLLRSIPNPNPDRLDSAFELNAVFHRPFLMTTKATRSKSPQMGCPGSWRIEWIGSGSQDCVVSATFVWRGFAVKLLWLVSTTSSTEVVIILGTPLIFIAQGQERFAHGAYMVLGWKGSKRSSTPQPQRSCQCAR